MKKDPLLPKRAQDSLERALYLPVPNSPTRVLDFTFGGEVERISRNFLKSRELIQKRMMFQ
jgi:hypothetical protein